MDLYSKKFNCIAVRKSFIVLILSRMYKVNCIKIIYIESMISRIVHPAEMFKEAILSTAAEFSSLIFFSTKLLHRLIKISL